jgi:cytochrome b6-f complex iron-sulfur subunit
MKINRREFLTLMATFVAGCSSVQKISAPSSVKNRLVNAGPVSNYAAEGVYAAFRSQGFFIIRQGAKLFALSSVCTHRRCLVDVEPDRSFFCPCHGSIFSPDGDVTHGPARRNLPVLGTSVNENGELLVTIPAT